MIEEYGDEATHTKMEEKPYIEKDDLFYNHQQLISQGLIFDNGIGRMNTDALQTFKITKRGCEFLNYIKQT